MHVIIYILFWFSITFYHRPKWISSNRYSYTYHTPNKDQNWPNDGRTTRLWPEQNRSDLLSRIRSSSDDEECEEFDQIEQNDPPSTADDVVKEEDDEDADFGGQGEAEHQAQEARNEGDGWFEVYK